MKGDESGIDWRMETIDFSEGLTLGLFLTEKDIRRAMQDELASSRCLVSSWTAFPLKPCGMRGY